MNYHALTEKVQQHARAFFNNPAHRSLPYHNLQHTEEVVAAAIRIGHHYQLSDADFFVAVTAAWFHDMGYLSGPQAGHEQEGAAMARLFLEQIPLPDSFIQQVTDCIVATRLPQSPRTLLEEIVCDADLFHLGTAAFASRNKLMRKEMEMTAGNAVNKTGWRKTTIALFQSHHYHTDYCRSLLDSGKAANLEKLLKKEQAAENESVTVPAKLPDALPSNLQPIQKKQHTQGEGARPDKGIETMFRVAATNHQRLSDMSDNKAHIMISVNSIIISVIIGLVVRRLDTSPHIIVPTLILLSGCMAAIVLSVLATRPTIPDGVFTHEQVADKTVNLLFFGHFYKMDFAAYYEGMTAVMNDREFLYRSLTRDIHAQGVVLGRKFKLIRISYTIFMFTLILSILAFAIASLIFM